MSIVTVWKERNTVIFATDSRSTNLDASAVSDTETKIFEVGPGTFIAHVGIICACEFQTERARKIASGTTDIQVIARELGIASVPFLKMVLERLRTQKDEVARKKVSGAELLQGYTLVGRSGGKIGYVTQTYWAQPDGTVKYITDSYFDAPRKLAAHAGTPIELMKKISVEIANNPRSWTDPMDQVSMRFLETAKRVTPSIGGPWQIVKLDSAGTHWVSLPAWAKPEGRKMDNASLRLEHGSNSIAVAADGVAIVGGSFTATSGPSYISINAGGNALRVSDSAGTNFVNIVYSVIQAASGSVASSLSYNGLQIGAGGADHAAMSPTGLLISGFPSSSPGSKQFWYDPTDSNRVKYTP